LRILLILFLALSFWFFLDRLLKYLISLGQPAGTRGVSGKPRARAVEGDDMVQDPQCKVYIPLSRAVERKVGGETHYFCSEDCARKYIKNLPS